MTNLEYRLMGADKDLFYFWKSLFSQRERDEQDKIYCPEEEIADLGIDFGFEAGPDDEYDDTPGIRKNIARLCEERWFCAFSAEQAESIYRAISPLKVALSTPVARYDAKEFAQGCKKYGITDLLWDDWCSKNCIW